MAVAAFYGDDLTGSVDALLQFRRAGLSGVLVTRPDVEVDAKVTVLRFENEAEELLHLFKAEGFEPGREGVIAESAEDTVSVDFGEITATLTRSVAETVSVRADPSPPERTALPEQLVLSKDRYGR